MRETPADWNDEALYPAPVRGPLPLPVVEEDAGPEKSHRVGVVTGRGAAVAEGTAPCRKEQY